MGVFNVVTRQMKFQGLPGHSETIFDVRYKPDSPETLATASFDGAVKVGLLFLLGLCPPLRSSCQGSWLAPLLTRLCPTPVICIRIHARSTQCTP